MHVCTVVCPIRIHACTCAQLCAQLGYMHARVHSCAKLGYMHARVHSFVGTHEYAKMGSESTQSNTYYVNTILSY